MPYSYNGFKNFISVHFELNFSKDIKILDVGAGAGTYSDLLNANFKNIDGIEIYQPYVDMFELRNKYMNLYIGDIREFDIMPYDYIIMGDILEHLCVYDAQQILNKITLLGKKCLVAVPYMFTQGEEFGNIHETHLQPDLTPEIFLMRYPMMNHLVGDEKYGYYINY
jgi:cyclopropane fatty-acyl-phospholipid synthase-like methyltransferase